MATAATQPVSNPKPQQSPSSSDDSFHDALETQSSHQILSLPSTYSIIDPLPLQTLFPNKEKEIHLSIFRIVKEILGSVKLGSDVTHINLPASILDPVSTLEKTKKSMQRGELLQDVCTAPDPHSRFLNLLRFNFSGLAKERFGKKPYNPILGEVYRCLFPHRAAAGQTLLVAEQVSHHPPITALHLRNDTLGFRMNSYTAPEPRFWGNSLSVKLAGEIRVVLTNFEEEYVITRPFINMTGFLAGKERLEFNGLSTFVCEKTGLGAEVEYKARSSLALRADLNGISGRVFDLASSKTLYTMEGHWDRKVMLTDVRTKATRTLFDYDMVLTEKSMVAVLPPAEEEESSFSTRVWADCSKAIRSGDSERANEEKRKVEDRQRQVKKERVAGGVEWKCRYFRKRDDGLEGYVLRTDDTSDDLAELVLSEPEIESLRNGEMVRELQSGGEESSEQNGDGRRIGRLKMMGRGRSKA